MITQKITKVFFAFILVFLASFFVLPKENASAIIVNDTASCTGVAFTPSCNNFTNITIDTTVVTKIEVVDNRFDDCGEVIITPPSGITFTWRSGNTTNLGGGNFNCTGSAISFIANGDKTALFTEIGTYNITIDGRNWGGSVGSFVDFELTYPDEICTGGGDEDSDGDVDCLDSDCVGVAPCCGDGNVTGFEGCDINGNIGCVGSEICAGCNSCISSSTAGECPAGFDDCDCDGTCEMDVSSDPLNCGKCGNVCPGNYCNNGTCAPVIGGLVPCGRMYDSPNTIWNEQEPCQICHVVPLAKNTIDYLVGIVGLISVLFIIIAGIISVTSMGSANALNLAKTAVSKSLYGFIFVLIAWLIINIGMVIFGFNDPMGDGSWNKFDCDLITTPINHYCGDGIIDNPNSDGIAETCDPMELKIDFIARTGLTPEDWVEAIYACNPVTCDFECAGDPLVAQIGEGCYQPDLADGGLGTPCQKGRYICDFDTDTVICQNTYNDPAYRLPGHYCSDIYDECCVDGGAALPGMTFDIVRLPTTNITSCNDWDCYWPGHVDGVCSCPAGYSCDDICKDNGGKVCIGVGLMDVSAYHCISLKDNFGNASCSGDYQCNNSANLLTNDCRAEFYTTIWTCDECSDVSPVDGVLEAYDFSVGETACYCK